MLGASGLVITLFRAGLAIRRVTEFMGTGMLEVIDVLLSIGMMILLVLASPHRVCKMHGYQILDVFEDGDDSYDSDSRILMTTVIGVVATHLGLPVRWCKMVPLELAAVLLYVFWSYVIPSEEPLDRRNVNLLLLTGLVGMSALGKRGAELDERDGFFGMIEEKTRRVELEFELAQVNLTGGPLRPLDSRSQAEASVPETAPVSVPETTGSGRVFEPCLTPTVDVQAQLARVVEVGDAERWKIEDNEVSVMEDMVLGTGGFGTVFKGLFSGIWVAVKRPRLRLEGLEERKIGAVCNEIRVLRHLRHPNIVAVFGAVIVPSREEISLVLELLDGVRLSSFLLNDLQDQGPRTAPTLLAKYQIMLGICQALFYMHTRTPRIFHGDLKGSNVLLMINGMDVHPKLLDFGLSRVLTRNVRPLGGTLVFMPPEVFMGRGTLKCSADIYSYGHLLAFTMTGIPPCLGMTHQQVQRALRNSEPPLPMWPSQCAFKTSCKLLVEACLRAVEDERPSIQQIYDKLLTLPDQEDLSEMRGPFIDKSRTMAEHMATPNEQLPAHEPPEAPPAAPRADEQDPGAESGLPPLPEGQALSGVEMEQGQRQGHRRRQRRLAPYPDTKETITAAMETSIDKAVARWNFKVPESFCCERHALAALAQKVASLASARPCTLYRIYRPDPNAQCKHCGILNIVDGVCDMCGTRHDENGNDLDGSAAAEPTSDAHPDRRVPLSL